MMARSFEDSGRGDMTRSISAAMATTTTLREPLGERPKECPDHGAYTSSGMRYLGTREVWTPCPDCEEIRIATERQAEAQKQAERAQARLEAMLGEAAIPKRFMGRSLDNFRVDNPGQADALDVAREYAENFAAHAERGDGLVFAGLPGTGKSHLATAIMQSLMPQVGSLYVTCSGLIRAVRDTWSRNSLRSESEVLQAFSTVPLLVVDEVGATAGSDNEQSLIFEVLDRRYREVLPTILLTNLDKGGFKNFVGDRVFDRLTETSQWIGFGWASYRPTARKGPPSNDSQFNRTDGQARP